LPVRSSGVFWSGAGRTFLDDVWLLGMISFVECTLGVKITVYSSDGFEFARPWNYLRSLRLGEKTIKGLGNSCWAHSLGWRSLGASFGGGNMFSGPMHF